MDLALRRGSEIASSDDAEDLRRRSLVFGGVRKRKPNVGVFFG